MHVRPARVSDAEALAIIHVRAWQAAYRRLVPQEYLDGLDPTQRQEGWERRIRSAQPPAGTSVLEHDVEGVIGFVNVSPSRDQDTDPVVVGEINAVYLLPEHWRRGGGTILMNAALRRLADAGFREAVLWVLETNEAARRFYEGGGWQADGSVKADDSRGFPLVEVRYRRYDLAAGRH